MADTTETLWARAERLLKAVTKASEWQCIRRDREDGRIEYQIFADSDPYGEQIAFVQSTRGDAEFIAASPYIVRDLGRRARKVVQPTADALDATSRSPRGRSLLPDTEGEEVKNDQGIVANAEVPLISLDSTVS